MKILIVVDMQNDFVSGSLGTSEARSIVPKVTEKIETHLKNKNMVVFTRDTHDSNYLETFEGENLPVEHCIENTHGWEIVDELKDFVKKAEVVINKPTFGSFKLLEFLEKLIKKRDIKKIELCGLCTDICVVTNALLLRTKFPELPIVIDASCCAGVTEESHEYALKTMEACQIGVIY